jgi:hypothetical protein
MVSAAKSSKGPIEQLEALSRSVAELEWFGGWLKYAEKVTL